jgi:predicted nucleotidyltransferase
MKLNRENINAAVNRLHSKLTEKFGRGIEIYIFGSAARGDFKDDSDIDILVLVPFPLNNSIEEEIIDVAYDIELECDLVLGIVVYPIEFWLSSLAQSMPLYENIKKEGVHV